MTITVSDDLYSQCLMIASTNGHASCHEWMQEIGTAGMGMEYSQAVTIMDRMEAEGVVGGVGANEGRRPRPLL